MDAKQHYSKNTKAYYNERFGTATSAALNREEQIRWNAIRDKIDQYFSKPVNKPLSILDFGCGDGRFSQLLSDFGVVHALDFAEEAIQKAQQQYPQVHFQSGDASDPHIPERFNEAFDLLVSTEVLEHLLDQDQYLANISSLLKLHGLLILTTPNRKWYNQYFEYGKRTSDQPYEHWMDRATLEQKLSTLGFELLHSSTIRSEWIFSFRTFGWLRLFGNRFFHKLLRMTGLRKSFLKLADKWGLGIYSIIVAKKF